MRGFIEISDYNEKRKYINVSYILIKSLLFYIKWHWKNRKWENCRHKRRAYKRAWLKQFRKDGVRNEM